MFLKSEKKEQKRKEEEKLRAQEEKRIAKAKQEEQERLARSRREIERTRRKESGVATTVDIRSLSGWIALLQV